jgi:epoxyqueuosine reductase
MAATASLTAEIISQAESYDGVRAGIIGLADVLRGPSYEATSDVLIKKPRLDDVQVVNWPKTARTVLILGLHHPEKDPRLDWWEQGDSWGNRNLREISESLRHWLREEHRITALPLPYHLEKGGIFLKDAAVLSGMGIIGRNNLLLHQEWGPRIRLRSILLEGDFHATESLAGFSPCETCERFCQKACPVKAFPYGEYSLSICRKQMDADDANKVPDGLIGKNGRRNWVVKYCRACELACPVGA